VISVPLPRPFNVRRTLGFLRRSSLRTPYHFIDGDRVRRLIRLGGRSALIEFRFATHPRGRLQATIVRTRGKMGHRPPAGPLATGALRRLAAAVWSLDHDLARCYRAFAGDPVMTRLLGHCRGLRMIRTTDVYEALLIAVVNQQVSVASAESIRRRINAALGTRMVNDGFRYVSYPTPRQILEAGIAELRTLGLSRQKARYMLEVAERAAAGALDETIFSALDDAAAAAKLMEIPGVGRWTAEIVMMRGLGRLDVFPAGDVGLAVAVQRAWGRPNRPTEDEMRDLAARWAGWRSYGALYLWHSLGITA